MSNVTHSEQSTNVLVGINLFSSELVQETLIYLSGITCVPSGLGSLNRFLSHMFLLAYPFLALFYLTAAKKIYILAYDCGSSTFRKTISEC